MKLSDLVRYLNHLDTLSVRDAASTAMTEVSKITHIVQHDQVYVGKHADTMKSIQHDIETSLQQYQQVLDQLRDDVYQFIQQRESTYFSASTDNYQQNMKHDTSEYILGRMLSTSKESNNLLHERLVFHADWRYPGMVIRPTHNPGLNSLVALDPLYLVDTHKDLLDPVKSLFTPDYQSRLRYYVIEEYTSDKIFWNLPQQQFGFVCAFRYFEFKPWEILQQYITEVFDLLRPGGTFLFSFNDCDYSNAVGLAEHNFCCYTPGRLIREHIKKLGFEIINAHNDHAGTAWLEIKKTGQIDSIRGGQALARILGGTIPVNDSPEVIDKSVKNLYNEMELDMLIELARVLNVDINEATTKREFDIKKVRRTISAHLEKENYSKDYLQQLFKKENP